MCTIDAARAQIRHTTSNTRANTRELANGRRMARRVFARVGSNPMQIFRLTAYMPNASSGPTKTKPVTSPISPPGQPGDQQGQQGTEPAPGHAQAGRSAVIAPARGQPFQRVAGLELLAGCRERPDVLHGGFFGLAFEFRHDSPMPICRYTAEYRRFSESWKKPPRPAASLVRVAARCEAVLRRIFRRNHPRCRSGFARCASGSRPRGLR